MHNETFFWPSSIEMSSLHYVMVFQPDTTHPHIKESVGKICDNRSLIQKNFLNATVNFHSEFKSQL